MKAFLSGILIVALGLCVAIRHFPNPVEASAAQAEGSQGKTKVVLLGTGTPQTYPDRSGPAVAIIVNDTAYLVDCGPGVVRRAAMARNLGITGLADKNLKRLFVTHLHSDHTAGYADVILTPWVMGRTEPLEVYGPSGIAEMTDYILKAYHKDIEIRTKGLEEQPARGVEVHAHEIQPGVVYKDENVKVKAFLVRHGSWDQAFGYRFETPDRTIVISGDTTKTDAIVENCHGCDMLLHEVYSAKRLREQSERWQKYHSAFHTSAPDLAELATRAKPGVLILYHQILGWATEEDIMAEIHAGYTGKVVFGNDLDVY